MSSPPARLMIELFEFYEDPVHCFLAGPQLQPNIQKFMTMNLFRPLVEGLPPKHLIGMAPYSPFLTILCLFPRGDEIVVRKRCVDGAVVLISVVAGLLLIVNPARPLFPTTRVIGLLR